MTISNLSEDIEKAASSAPELRGHWVVVMNHHETRIFRSTAPGTKAEQILPHKPEDFFRHAHNSKDFAKGQEKPDPNSFFEPIAKALNGAHQLLTFGSGTGSANETDHFVAWLKVHHADLAKRIVGSLIIDEHHVTDAQLLAKAREFYALPRMPSQTAS